MADTTTPEDLLDLTKEELYDRAKKHGIEGRSNMTKQELVKTLNLAQDSRNAVDLVLDQHARIRSLLDDFAACSSRPSKKKDEIVGELVTTLVKHARMEELVLYPAVREELPDLADELDEGLEEHHLADLALAEIQSMDSTDERFDMKVHVMAEAMAHHLEEEEQDLLPKIRRGMDDLRLLEIGKAMEQAWRTAPTLAHPSAPQTPPANAVATVVGTATDLVRNGFELLKRRIKH